MTGKAGGRVRHHHRGIPCDIALKGILDYSEEPLVSVDYIGNPFSCTLDAKSTNVIDGTMVKLSGWYDNEWGYSSRCVDLLEMVGKGL